MSNRRRPTTPAPRLLLAAAGATLVDHQERTISGLVVPHGPAGATSAGSFTFAAGSLTYSQARRVKLLREHDQRDVVGLGVSFEDIDAAEVDRRMAAAGHDPLGVPGTWAVFHVPAGANGDRALAEAGNGLRDGFSVGVQLDAATTARIRAAAPGATVPGSGALREVSLVSVPAFDDARAAASADLVLSSWATATTPATPQTHPTRKETPMMTPEQRARLDALLALDTLTQDEAAEMATLTALAGAVEDAPAGEAAPAAAAEAAARLTTAAQRPATVPAVAGAAVITSQPTTYDFTTGNSLVRDLWAGGQRGDHDAQRRVDRFNAELADGNPASVVALLTAAATTGDVDGAGTDLPSFFAPNPNRPDLMRAAVDVKRPFISRLDRIPISTAQPFAIPKVGRFEGVGAHTEGEPHRTPGTLTLGGDTMQPTATSGAWEVSRELLDAATPALDRIAAREMLKDYARQSEGKIISLAAARAAQPGSTIYNVDTALAMRGAMLDFVNDDDEAADLVIVSKTMLKRLGLDEDGDGRPQLPFITPVNSTGTLRAGYTGLAIDGVEISRSARLDSGVGAGSGVIARKDGILWAESSVLQFRFDEVKGPGVIVLALWAYSGAAILDTADVSILSTGAAIATDQDPDS